MIEQTLYYGLVCIAGQWQTVNNANIATADQNAILLNFTSEKKRQAYITENQIQLTNDNPNTDH
jgi:hypothetical protein